MHHLVRLSVIMFVLAVWVPQHTQAQELQRYESLQQALFSAGNLSGGNGPGSVNWIANGDRLSYMTRNAETGLSEIYTFDPASGEDVLVFDGASVTFPGSEVPFSFRSFQWSDDARYIIFQTNFEPIYRYSGTADYFYYALEDQSLELVASRAFTAELSPDGTLLAYHKDGNMFVYDLETKTERQLTFGDEENVFYGRFGWVYEEEFGLVQAWKWSHDSRHIAFWKSDEREVPMFRTTDFEGTHPEWFEIPFPKVGDTNPTVEIGVIDVNSAETVWMELDLGDGYVPRIYWTADPGRLAVTTMNRAQTELGLHLYDIKSGAGERVMHEESEVWIDVFDFFAGIDDYFFFPQETESFFWISDRDGWKHIYHFSYEGELIRQVTSGDWQVTFVHAVDAENELIYYTSTEVSPLERHLYRIAFDGSGKERITQVPGRHRVDMGPNGRFFIDRYSNTETPRQVELWGTQPVRMIQKLEDNAAVLDFITEFAYSPRQLFSFVTSEGVPLDGSLVLPPDFDETKSYPLVLSIYGGPSAQGVYNEFEANGFIQFLAQQGYVVANVNNRGSGGYGRDFEKSVYLRLGHLEARDFAETVNWLAAEHPWIDGDRMMIYGHSYGGYMSALTMGLEPGVFQSAIVAAPVTDWRLYDTIYTERYMGLLDENLEGYIQSSVMTHVGNIEGRLLLVHSAMDENVHLQNTMQLVTALTNAGKDAELRIYPPGDHRVWYNLPSYLLLHETYFDFIERTIGSRSR
ncbi:MAG: DPP IV N-terminal domain-containing protein [Candidatus Cyclonatronum sp.]|uniref:S9 family peptidase n=1 Tax=Cyclonatronum sp. TaxID=3024185 RepID=UPI0025BA2113|nr:S9 family peptidase [Cyclonatronum sp.]MCH8485772.1 DPP IV N-terminal domain-containing protein [Cyclonatronum sp.]